MQSTFWLRFLVRIIYYHHFLDIFTFSPKVNFGQPGSNLVNRALKSLEIAPEWLEIFCYLTHTILILHLITYLWYISSHFISWRVIFQFRSRGGRMITSLNFSKSGFLWFSHQHISLLGASLLTYLNFSIFQVLGQSNPNPWGPSFVLEMVLEINLSGIGAI